MSTEDRLREALHEVADAIEPVPDSWSRIAARLDEPNRPRAPRPRPLALIAAALAVVVIAGAALVVRADDRRGSHRRIAVGGGGAVAMPDYAVAVTDAHDLVVMDARTGEVVRTLASDVRVRAGSPALAPTPDGKNVYFTSQVPPDLAGSCPDAIDVVLRVPVEGGTVGRFGTGAAVALSPDGDWLASAPLERVDGCLEPGRIVEVRPTASGGSATSIPTVGAASDLSFAPDDRQIAFWIPPPDHQSTAVAALDDPTRPQSMGWWSDAMGPYTFRGRTGELIGVHDEVRITRADPEARRFLPDLARSPVPVAGAVRSDPSGDNLLWTGTDGGLYHWSALDGVVRRTAGGVVAAAWLPTSTALVRPPVDAPVIVSLRSDRLDLLDAGGARTGTLGPFPGSGSVAATPDGEDVLVSYTADAGGCGGSGGSAQPQIDRIDVRTKARSRVVGGSRTPVVTPNGTYVAYGMECDGVALGVTNLLTGENYRTDFLPTSTANGNVTRVEVLGASPNSRRLVYRVTYPGLPDPRYYAACLWPLVEHKDHSLVELPYGPRITAVAFAGDDDVALAETVAGSSEIRRWSLRQTGGRKESSPVLFTVPDRVTALVADATAGRFLALTEAGVLYRWSTGDPGPAQLADGVSAAAWRGAG
jgi:hypothetical protein